VDDGRKALLAQLVREHPATLGRARQLIYIVPVF
jgi:hypothetical protein